MSADEKKPTIPNEGYMRLPAVLSVFPVSRSTWWAGISAGRFPIAARDQAAGNVRAGGAP